jgi:hypothetical protein
MKRGAQLSAVFPWRMGMEPNTPWCSRQVPTHGREASGRPEAVGWPSEPESTPRPEEARGDFRGVMGETASSVPLGDHP